MNSADDVVDHSYVRGIANGVYLVFKAEPLKRSLYNIAGGRNWTMR